MTFDPPCKGDNTAITNPLPGSIRKLFDLIGATLIKLNEIFFYFSFRRHVTFFLLSNKMANELLPTCCFSSNGYRGGRELSLSLSLSSRCRVRRSQLKARGRTKRKKKIHARHVTSYARRPKRHAPTLRTWPIGIKKKEPLKTPSVPLPLLHTSNLDQVT